MWSTSTDSAKNKLQNINFWDDFINSNYFEYLDENANAGFGDMLTDEITAICNCGDDVLKLFREIRII